MVVPLEIVALVALGLAFATGLLFWQQRRRNEHRARNLRALFTVARQATANLGQAQMLEVVVQAVQEVMGYRMASILLLDEVKQELECAAISSNLRGLIPVGDRVPIQRGMLGAAVRLGRTQLANDVTKHPHYVRVRQGGWDPGSELSVPLTAGDRIVGVLDVQDRRRSAFNGDDVQVLEALAEQIVVILEKARLFENERRRAERTVTLTRLARLMTASLSMDELLATAIEAINTQLQFPHLALLLLDPNDSETLILRAKSGVYLTNVSGEYRQSIHHGLIGRAARTRQPVLVNEAASDPDYVPVPNARPGAELALPLQTGGRLLGVLNIEDERPFSAEEVNGLQLITDQLAVAIDNAELFADTQSNLHQLSVLYTLSQRLSLAQDADEVMWAALETLTVRCPYRVTIALHSEFDAAGNPTQFHVPVVFEPGQGLRRTNVTVPTGPDALNVLLNNGQTVAIADVQADPRVPELLRREQQSAGRPALVLIPLIVGRQRIGNLILAHTQPHAWNEAELRLFRSSANQIAVSIENARRLVQERERTERLGLIARVGQRIAARLEADELLHTTTEALQQRLGYDHVSIFLLDPNDPTMLEQRARVSRFVRDSEERPIYRQSIERGILGTVARRRVAEIVNDVSRDPRYISPSPDIRSELAVPIVLGSRLWGVLDIAGTRPFHEDDLTGLTIVADHLAIALENAALYERAQAAAVLEERQRLARDLHDSVTQLIFSITLVAQSTPAAFRRDAHEGQQRLGRVVELSQQALTEMRALLAELRPESVIREGLLPALHKQIERVAARDSLHIQLHAEGYQPRSQEQEEALYRVVQESLNNVIKHAGAERVTIELGPANGCVELRISDDGRGFDPSLPRAGGLGLVGMRERVERLGGALSVQTQPGAGVVIQARLPDSPAAASVAAHRRPVASDLARGEGDDDVSRHNS